MREDMTWLRHKLLVPAASALVFACAAKVRIDLPIEGAHSLVLRDPRGTPLRTIRDRVAIAALDHRLGRISGWFDDVVPRKRSVEYTVDVMQEATVIGTLTLEASFVRYHPGKGGAPISRTEHDDLVRILEQRHTPRVQ